MGFLFKRKKISLFHDSRKLIHAKCNFFRLAKINTLENLYAQAWPTKYTAVYVTFEGQKLRDQFSENLVLRIYEFLFNSGGKISKEKRIMKVLRIKN